MSKLSIMSKLSTDWKIEKKTILLWDKGINKSKKGQFFSYDAIVAGLLFILLLSLLYIYWNSLRTTISINIDDSTRIALDVSDMLLTPGYPLNWDSTNFNQLGLTKDYNTIVIDENKVGNLSTIGLYNYTLLKQKLAVGPNEIYIKIGTGITIGMQPEASTSLVTITRPAVYKGNLTNLSITIWRP